MTPKNIKDVPEDAQYKNILVGLYLLRVKNKDVKKMSIKAFLLHLLSTLNSYLFN